MKRYGEGGGRVGGRSLGRTQQQVYVTEVKILASPTYVYMFLLGYS